MYTHHLHCAKVSAMKNTDTHTQLPSTPGRCSRSQLERGAVSPSAIQGGEVYFISVLLLGFEFCVLSHSFVCPIWKWRRMYKIHSLAQSQECWVSRCSGFVIINWTHVWIAPTWYLSFCAFSRLLLCWVLLCRIDQRHRQALYGPMLVCGHRNRDLSESQHLFI